MCGRFSQTGAAILTACDSLGISPPSSDEESPGTQQTQVQPQVQSDTGIKTVASHQAEQHVLLRNNYNLSPGMDAAVVVLNRTTESDSCNKQPVRQPVLTRKVWGLVPRGGTTDSPLAQGMSKHFSNLMFNARYETLTEKQTFSRLIKNERSCVLMMNGFFEWKEEAGGFGPGKKQKKKQPYYVYGKESSRQLLLLPGLWTSVPTGRAEQPTLDTFTLITTAACPDLRCLHHRMPVCFNSPVAAREWLNNPDPSLLPSQWLTTFKWHAVSTKMSSLKYREADAVNALPKLVTVESMFRHQQKQAETDSILFTKRPASKTLTRPTPTRPKTTTTTKADHRKKQKKQKPLEPGQKTMLAFLSPKKEGKND